MSRRAALGAGALVLVALFVAWIVWRPVAPTNRPPARPAETLDAAKALRERTISLDQIAGPGASPQEKIKRVYVLVQNYTQAMRGRGGPPLSSNQDFTRAFTGRNPLKVPFLPKDHPAINEKGELIDAWDTPYFFHVLAADIVEVQSAGPDRIPFNADDLIFPPPKPQDALLSTIRSEGMRDGPRKMKSPGPR